MQAAKPIVARMLHGINAKTSRRDPGWLVKSPKGYRDLGRLGLGEIVLPKRVRGPQLAHKPLESRASLGAQPSPLAGRQMNIASRSRQRAYPPHGG